MPADQIRARETAPLRTRVGGFPMGEVAPSARLDEGWPAQIRNPPPWLAHSAIAFLRKRTPEADAPGFRSTKRLRPQATLCIGALRCSILDVVMHG